MGHPVKSAVTVLPYLWSVAVNMSYLYLSFGETIDDMEQNIFTIILPFNKDFLKGFGQNHMDC